MILRGVLIWMVFLVFALSVNAQYYSYSQHINHADKAFDAGNYIEALMK
jgi:hypothetical protein